MHISYFFEVVIIVLISIFNHAFRTNEFVAILTEELEFVPWVFGAFVLGPLKFEYSWYVFKFRWLKNYVLALWLFSWIFGYGVIFWPVREVHFIFLNGYWIFWLKLNMVYQFAFVFAKPFLLSMAIDHLFINWVTHRTFFLNFKIDWLCHDNIWENYKFHHEGGRQLRWVDNQMVSLKHARAWLLKKWNWRFGWLLSMRFLDRWLLHVI